MEEFNNVPSTGKYGDSISIINQNFQMTHQGMQMLKELVSPNPKYVTVEATSQTIDVHSVLPATGAKDTIYRVGKWDGAQYDVTKYTKYGWDGTDYVTLATESQVDEVFDISVYRASGGTLAEYADISAALGTNGVNVPEGIRKGGMSVKFIQSSDHKYVQYMLTYNGWTTIPLYWKSDSELEKEVQDNAYDVTQKKTFLGSGWVDITYTMNSELTYNIQKVNGAGSIIALSAKDGNGQNVTVTGFTSLVNIGDNCNINVAKDCVSLRIYFDGQCAIDIKNNLLEYTLSETKKLEGNDVQMQENIDRCDSALFQKSNFSASGWSSWFEYTFRKGYSYKISNVSANSAAKIISFQLRDSNGQTVTYSGDAITNLAVGNSATIIPNGDAVELKMYCDGAYGTISIESLIQIIPNLYNLNDFAKIQEGYSQKDYIKKVLSVSKTGQSGHYSTIAAALAAITDSSFAKQYEVVVYPGVYGEINLAVPPFTHIHGAFPNSVVVTSKGYTTTQPVFEQANGSSKLSNMTIDSHTGYCIHFDENLHLQTIINENLTLNKVDRGTGATNWSIIGGGTFLYGTKFVWKNCIFRCTELGNGDASCHTNGNQVNGNTHLIFDGCLFVNCSPSIGSVGGSGNYVCELINCSFPVGAKGLTNWYSHIRNIEDPTMYLLNMNEWQIIGGGNKNLSMWQLQAGKSIRLVADYPITISGSAASIIFGYSPTKNDAKTARLSCMLTSQYYIDDSQAGYSGYSELKDVYQLWKRLGDCSITNKELSVTVNGVTKTFTFTENYLVSKKAQATIIAEMQAVLDNVTIEAFSQTGYSYDNVNTSDAMVVKVASADILKGEFVTMSGAKATSSTPIVDIIGVACEDKPQGEYVKVWTSAFRFDTDYADGEYGLDVNGVLDASAETKIGFVKNKIFYLK